MVVHSPHVRVAVKVAIDPAQARASSFQRANLAADHLAMSKLSELI
jgi:hypothetical protein